MGTDQERDLRVAAAQDQDLDARVAAAMNLDEEVLFGALGAHAMATRHGVNLGQKVLLGALSAHVKATHGGFLDREELPLAALGVSFSRHWARRRWPPPLKNRRVARRCFPAHRGNR
jgi:hypothetical protein